MTTTDFGKRTVDALDRWRMCPEWPNVEPLCEVKESPEYPFSHVLGVAPPVQTELSRRFWIGLRNIAILEAVVFGGGWLIGRGLGWW